MLRLASAFVTAVAVGIGGVGVFAVASGPIDGAATAASRAARVDTPAPPPATTPPPPERTIADEVVDLVNVERARRGLSAVAPQPQVADAAEIHTRDMAATRNLSHTGSDGSDTGDRLDRAGFRWRSWGETVAAGQRSPASVVDAWMNSDGHRRILLGDYAVIGASMVPDATGVRYWTIVVAS